MPGISAAVILLLAVAGACGGVPAEPTLTLVRDAGQAAPADSGHRVLVRCPGVTPERVAQGEWALIDLFGPLPAPDGTDLLERHPEWVATGPEGVGVLAGSPCYALPEVREARVRHVLAYAGAAGVCVSALPPSSWPAGVNVARTCGLNAPLIAAFRQAHGRDPAPGLDRALLAGLKADLIGELLRAIRQARPELHLALACAETDLLPYSATGAALDVPAWIARGLVDEVMVQSTRSPNVLGLKLATDRELRCLAWCRVSTDAEMRSAAGLAARTPGLDGVVLEGPVDAGRFARALSEARQRCVEQTARQAALRAAVAGGEVVTLAGVVLKEPLDQASIHGVAQSFSLAKPARMTALGIVAALRGPDAAGLPPLQLVVVADEGGKPGNVVLGSAALGPESFSPEPGYGWAYAYLDSPLQLEAGRTYWLHAPDPRGATASYVWRISKGDVYPGGHAWSSKYDYTRADWVFAILAPKE